MTDEQAVALFALLGVIAGGLITFVTQLVLARRQERARTRAAARVMHSEFLKLHAIVTAGVDLKLEGSRLLDNRRLDAAWDRYRGDLSGLPLEDWLKVANAVTMLTLTAHPTIRADLAASALADGLEALKSAM